MSSFAPRKNALSRSERRQTAASLLDTLIMSGRAARSTFSRSSDMPPAERGAEENQAEAQECETRTTEERRGRGDGQLE